MSGPTRYLRELSECLIEAYAAHADLRAVLLCGSAATGTADAFSDLDLFIYHDELPPEDALVRAQRQIDGVGYRCTWRTDEGGRPDDHAYSERFFVNGIECQVAHEPVALVAQRIRRLTVDLDLNEGLLKAMSGLFEGLPLRGADLVERWRQQAAMTDQVQRALVEKRWQFFPWWYFQERMRARDSSL